MSSIAVAAGSGRYRSIFAWLALLAIALAVALRVGPRAVPREAPREDHRARGRSYEAHVFAPNHLPRLVQARRGQLRLHPAVRVPPSELPATYHASPEGFDGGAVVDPNPHLDAPKVWQAVGPGGVRIPDAIVRLANGREELYELKCPSPWLAFASGNPLRSFGATPHWGAASFARAAKMQAAFASQAMAFGVWGTLAPDRHVIYGFCGRVPPWAEAILADLEGRLGLRFEVREAYFLAGFTAGLRLVGQAQREALTSTGLLTLEALSLDAAMGVAYDALPD